MKRLMLILISLLALAIVGCSESTTTEWCEEACTIWTDCTGWNYQDCLNECRAEGDWDAGYLNCIENVSCENIYDCE